MSSWGRSRSPTRAGSDVDVYYTGRGTPCPWLPDPGINDASTLYVWNFIAAKKFLTESLSVTPVTSSNFVRRYSGSSVLAPKPGEDPDVARVAWEVRGTCRNSPPDMPSGKIDPDIDDGGTH